MRAIRSLWNAVIMRLYRDALGRLDNVPECSRAPLMAQASAWFSEKEGVFETLSDGSGLARNQSGKHSVRESNPAHYGGFSVSVLASQSAQRLLRNALETWGEGMQMRQLQEECGELVAAVNQYGRGRICVEDLAEEIADVEIMCAQIGMCLGGAFVDQAMNRKLARLRLVLGETTQPTGEVAP